MVDAGDCCLSTCVSGRVYECSESKTDYPECKGEQQQGQENVERDEVDEGDEGDEEDYGDDDFSKAFAQSPGIFMPLATLLALGCGMTLHLRRQ